MFCICDPPPQVAAWYFRRRTVSYMTAKQSSHVKQKRLSNVVVWSGLRRLQSKVGLHAVAEVKAATVFKVDGKHLVVLVDL